MSKSHTILGSLALGLISSASLPIIAGATIAASHSSAIAQSSTAEEASIRKAKRDALIALSRPITLDVENQPISDLFQFISDVTGAELLPLYLNDNVANNGMDPDTEITIKVTNSPALTVLERILGRTQRAEATGEEYTWQLTEYGEIECGPKSELNSEQRVELYDISDLIMIVPDFDNSPEFDLQSAVSAAGGGGGGQSPFSGGGQDIDQQSSAERAQALIDLIQNTVEPDQWAELGGDGASMTSFGNSLVITAPDYIHRQIIGYSFWPAKLHSVRKVDGRHQTIIKPDRSKYSSP